jgi:hypothetical protein
MPPITFVETDEDYEGDDDMRPPAPIPNLATESRLSVDAPEPEKLPPSVVAHVRSETMQNSSLYELLALARDIWGPRPVGKDSTNELLPVLGRLMVGVGDLFRVARDRPGWVMQCTPEMLLEVKKELGNVIFSTIRWCDDLGLDLGECVVLAVEAQRAFVASGKKR